MPIRFTRHPLGCIISCGAELDGFAMAVMAMPCALRERPAKLSKPAELVLRELVARRRCPVGKTHVARTLRGKGYASNAGERWEATTAGRRWVAKRDAGGTS